MWRGIRDTDTEDEEVTTIEEAADTVRVMDTGVDTAEEEASEVEVLVEGSGVDRGGSEEDTVMLDLEVTIGEVEVDGTEDRMGAVVDMDRMVATM